MTAQPEFHRLLVNTIKGLSMDAVQKANSGHPGMPMGMADTASVLWTRFLNHDPSHPNWPNRDRFVLSAGHGSMLLYSLLHLTGYEAMTLDQLKGFRSWESLTPGHPETQITPGVETTTGPLGQGVGNAVGMAIAEQFLAQRFNREGFPIIDHATYAIVGDGDLMEGLSYEATSLAGHLGLDRLILLYDDNDISIDGHTDLAFTEDVDQRFLSFGWHVQAVDGHHPEAVASALKAALAETSRPSIIRCQTHIGHGAPTKQDSAAAHGAPLGEEEILGTKQGLNWPTEPFYVPDELGDAMGSLQTGWANAYRDWDEMIGRYREAHPALAQELDTLLAGNLPTGWDAQLPSFDVGATMATRKSSGMVVNALAETLSTFVGGSADLEGSNNTRIKADEHMAPGDISQRNIHYGVREHAMGAICNGMALHGGVIPFCGTFLQFSDYMRPSVRLAALMEQRVVYVWTHDSVFLGEDGPTHQPVEHVSALRAIPNLRVFRPGDANEVKWAWKAAIEHTSGPTALALTRQGLPTLAETDRPDGVSRGGYVLWEADGEHHDLTILATGSEVSIAMESAHSLAERGVKARVVSLPCWELFDEQTADYRDEVLRPDVPVRLVVEAGRAHGWEKYAGPFSRTVTVESFGHSAPANVLADKLGFTTENVIVQAEAALADFKANAAGWIQHVGNALER